MTKKNRQKLAKELKLKLDEKGIKVRPEDEFITFPVGTGSVILAQAAECIEELVELYKK